MLDPYFPGTQLCPACGGKTPHSPDKRVYLCSWCGYTDPERDVHSAKNHLTEGLRMLKEGKNGLEDCPSILKLRGRCQGIIEKIVPAERRDVKLVEIVSAVAGFGDKTLSLKQEAHEFIRG